MADPESPLPGFVTFAHLAARVGITPNHLRVTLSDKEAPKLEPSYRIGGAYLYNEAEANEWLLRLQEWRDGSALRAAARKKEQEQRVLLKLEAEQKLLQAQAEVRASIHQAQEQAVAAIEAQRKADEETQRRIDRLAGRG